MFLLMLQFYCKSLKMIPVASVHFLTSLQKNYFCQRFVGWYVVHGDSQNWPSRFSEVTLILLSEAQKRTPDAFALRISAAATCERSNFNERMHRRARICTEVKGTYFEYFSYPRNRRLDKGLFNYSLKYSYVQY
jgi:hypothetical protein